MKFARCLAAGLLALIAFTAMPSIAAAEAGITAIGSAKSYDTNVATAIVASADQVATSSSNLAAPGVAAGGVDVACSNFGLLALIDAPYLDLVRPPTSTGGANHSSYDSTDTDATPTAAPADTGRSRST